MNAASKYARLAIALAIPQAFAAPETYFSWNAPSEPAAHSEFSLRTLNESFAGEKGQIKANGGRFIHEKTGETVRFWAVNGPSGWDLSDADLAREARLLATYGVNLVRVHGALFTERGELDNSRVLAVRRIVRAMKKEGIYTHVSLYFPLWFKPPADLSWLPGYDGQKFPFAVLMWNQSFQAKYKEWLTGLLTATDPGESRPLREEPALMGIEIQNEDSFFFWTFEEKNIPDVHLRTLEEQFGTWAAAKYGSVTEALSKWGTTLPRDNAPSGRIAFRPLWNIANEKTLRDKDTAAFLLETQAKFYRAMSDHLRTVGFKGLVTASNWATADAQILGPLEKWSYLDTDFVDRHGYLGVNAKGESSEWSIREGHDYRDRRVFRLESEESTTKSFVHPAMEIEYNGKPSMISETTWNRPNRHRGEAPFFIATYGALQGTDGIVHFAFDGSKWQAKPNFWMQPWTLMSPAMMGQFPVAARVYRQGLVDEGSVLADVVLNKADLLALQGTPLPQDAAFDDLRAKDIPAGTPGAKPNAVIDPLIHFAGRTRVTIGDAASSLTVADLTPLIDRTAQVVRSANNQVELNYGVGLLRVVAPRMEFVGGQLNADTSHRLDILEVKTDMDPAFVSLVSLDDKPIKTSGRLLLQVMSEERTKGFSTTDAGSGRRKITNKGTDPWEVRHLEGTITLHREDAKVKVFPLDAGGVRTGRTLSGTTFTLEAETVYYLIEVTSGDAPPLPPITGGRPINLSVLGRAGIGADTLTAGFVIEGEGAKSVLIRASGPSLSKFNVSGLQDPALKLYRGESLIAENDDWNSALATTFAAVGAFDWANGSKDAALLQDLTPGLYSAQVTNGDTSGRQALLEVYDVSQEKSSRFINLSCRNQLSTSEPLIVGLTLDEPAPVLLRSGGPSLTQFGLSTVAADPDLTVYDQQTAIDANDDWNPSLAPLFDRLGAYAYGSSTKDASLQLDVPPKQITAWARTKSGPGVGLIELYLLK
ncbi:MAG: hypothetical protein SFV32_10395 [Opitutaceae bacterium]|nr:hypothetical protein [Opitutaceae bacterium]